MNECYSPNFVSGLMVAGGAAGRGAAPATRRARPARRPSAKSTNGGERPRPTAESATQPYSSRKRPYSYTHFC